jgi:hypothetical protein
MSIPSEYVLYHMLTDLGFPAPAASRAVDVLQGRHDDGQDDDDGPESWDSWTDLDRWVPGPEPFEPNPDDEEWLGRQLTDDEIDAIALACAWQDALEGAGRITDQDIIATGQAPG